MIFRIALLALLSCHCHGAAEPEAGFESIFDGTLKDWDGDPVYWKAENGTLIGEVTPETLLKRNSFIIWRGGETKNFELKLEYRVSPQGNSGINYRSIEVPGVKWALQGYQDDIDGKDQWSGQNYEERGRTFLAYRGQSVVLAPGQKTRSRPRARRPCGASEKGGQGRLEPGPHHRPRKPPPALHQRRPHVRGPRRGSGKRGACRAC